MSKKSTQVTTIALPATGAEESIANSDIVKKYIFHWPLFLTGIVVFIGFAYFYIKHTNPVYPIVATIEFKAPTASSASLTVNQNSTEQELNPINTPVIVENEIEVMQSKKLVYQVVNQLQLWVAYSEKSKNGTAVDLYGRSPIKFQFVKQNETITPAGEKFQLKIVDSRTFLLKDTDGVFKKFSFNTPIKGDFGTWELVPTTALENHLGSVIDVSVMDPDLVSDAYKSGLKVALENKDAPFVNLSTTDNVPQRGKDVLNALMELYLKFAIEDKNKLSQRTLKFIEFRLDSLKLELDSIEKKIEVYRNRHNITDIKLQAQGYRDINLDNLKGLNVIESQLGVVAGLEKYLNSNQNVGGLPATSGLPLDAGLATLYEKLSELQLRRDELVATTPPANPMFVSIDQQIANLKSDFKNKLQNIKTSLLSQKRQLTSFSSNITSSLKQVPGEDREYASLQRIQESKENIYKFLLEKHEQVALRYASSVSDSEVVDDAHAGKVKWPIVPLIYGLALIFGLVAPAGILYARESLNDLINYRKQIEDKTDIPILGELAYEETDKQIVVSEGRSKFAIGEQFRVLRTNLFHLHNNNESGRVTLFTSSVSGEGKSFVSSNLAVTLAYTGRKIVILEMDLRKPKISVNFELTTEYPGISNYLNDELNDLNKLIRPSGIANLDVLSCGAIMPNPSELLESDKLDDLIDKLKLIYDDIIIDSAPIHLVTDALVISRVANTTLYVVRQGYTHKYELDFINEINETQRFPKLSIVFNGVKAGASGYGGYGYGYGYGGSSYGGYGYNTYNSYAPKKDFTIAGFLQSIFRRF